MGSQQDTFCNLAQIQTHRRQYRQDQYHCRLKLLTFKAAVSSLTCKAAMSSHCLTDHLSLALLPEPVAACCSTCLSEVQGASNNTQSYVSGSNLPQYLAESCGVSLQATSQVAQLHCIRWDDRRHIIHDSLINSKMSHVA